MTRLVAIVEGHGEVEAVPILIRRIVAAAVPGAGVEVAAPIRIPRSRLLKENELERVVELAARLSGQEGRILILLDADDDCPLHLGDQIRKRATAARSDRSIGVVLAKREYETWFMAAAESIAGCRGIRADASAPAGPEELRDAKGWVSQQMPAGRSYRETRDQAPLTAELNLQTARERSPSFDKMWREVLLLARNEGVE
jgi:hypothetical protein